MIEIKLDNKAKNTVSRTLDLGTNTKSLYPAIYQGGDRKVRVHCDKILERLIAEGADVDIEVSDFNYNKIDIGVYYLNGVSAGGGFTEIRMETNSATNYQAHIVGFNGQSKRVDVTETQQVAVTVRQMLEALGTIEFIANSACHVFPQLRYTYQSTGCFALTIPLTLDEYLEMVEFNIEITE